MSDDPQESSVHEPNAAPPVPEGASSSVKPVEELPTVVTGRRAPAGGTSGLFDPASLVRGEFLDHFQLQEYIGVGGMGTVFRAWDTMLQRPVALKVLPRDQSDAETTQRFVYEARAAARLNHENIARVYFVGEARGLHYIAFEFVEGTDVRKLIAQFGRLSVSDVVSNAIQIAGALKHAAARDVVHRDIKPSNIVVTPTGLAKLVDMGLARNYDTHGGLTASGVTLGTFDYLSPEQAHDPRTADVRSDIYSLGCTLYHMLTGEPPYVEGNALQKMLQHRESPPPDPRELNRDIPEELAQIVLRMMRKKPKDRYQSANELLRDLTALAGTLGLHSASPEGLIWMAPGSIPVPAWQRHAIWAVPVIGVLMIVAVAGILAQQGPEPAVVAQREREAASQRNRDVAAAPAQEDAASLPDGPSETVERADAPKAVDSQGLGQVEAGGGGSPSGPESQATLPSEPGEDATPPQQRTNQRRTTQDSLSDPKEATSGQAVERVNGSQGAEESSPTVREARPNGSGAPKPGIGESPSNGTVGGAPALPPFDASESPRVGTAPRAIAAPRALVVDPEGGEGTIDSLKVAVAQAMKGAGSVIELRFDGPMEQGPIPISGLKRLTIRAAEGFRPMLVFDARGIDADEPIHFISFIDGTLDLIGLEVVLDVPMRGGADDSAILSVKDAQRVHVQDCVFTLRNPAGRSAAFLEARWSWDDQGMGSPVPAPPEPTELKVEQSFLRGDGDIVSLRQPKDVRITLGNSNVFATERRLLSIEAQGMSAARVEVAVTHVTARVDEGLLEVNTAGGAKPRVEVRAEDNILIVSDRAPMIAHRGELPVLDFRDSFQWQAHRNFYEGVETFWEIDSTTTSTPGMAIVATENAFDAEYWQEFWGIDQESQPQIDAVWWERRLDRLTPTWLLPHDEFRLDNDPENPARRAADDRGDAGANLALVPAPAASRPGGAESREADRP